MVKVKNNQTWTKLIFTLGIGVQDDELHKDMVKELFRLAEEEFGTASSGPLTLPCDADFMEYVISFIKSHLTEEVEEALLTSMSCNCLHLQYWCQSLAMLFSFALL
ncbi:hypothetical protein SLE2022_144570 [Rubroshorea leprosula]